MKSVSIFAACSAVVILQGCAVITAPGSAPWDPPPGRALFEQLPNWDGAAERICGGHLHPDEARRQGKSQRC